MLFLVYRLPSDCLVCLRLGQSFWSSTWRIRRVRGTACSALGRIGPMGAGPVHACRQGVPRPLTVSSLVVAICESETKPRNALKTKRWLRFVSSEKTCPLLVFRLAVLDGQATRENQLRLTTTHGQGGPPTAHTSLPARRCISLRRVKHSQEWPLSTLFV
jgi:hypothetical protein